MARQRFLARDLLSRRQLAALTSWSLAKAVGMILLALALGSWIASLNDVATPPARVLLGLGLVGALLRAVSGWGLNVASRRMGLGAKEKMRATLVRHGAGQTTLGASQNSFSVPGTATLASHGLDQLDDYFTKFIPAMVSAFVVPLVLGLYILTVDLTSAIILLLTIPLVPLFMVLIGLHTQDKVAQSQRGLDALAHQLYELGLGLPALLGLGRARTHGNAIAGLGQRYRTVTMENLKTVFLSSFWLELISTLSVAVVAVFIGLRLVGGNMELGVGLIVLILAPEVFAALREVGSAYHAADDGLAAYGKYREVLSNGKSRAVTTSEPTGGEILRITNLSLSYAEGHQLYRGYGLTLRAGQRLVLDGPSGSGKSSLLKVIAESPTATGLDPQLVSGQISIDGELAVIEQHPVFNQPTGNLQLTQDAPRAGSELIGQLARQLQLEELLARDIAGYSPGELRRLEVLRALARVQSDPAVKLLLADEPTAHLDEDNAAAVRRLLGELPQHCAALIASHDVLLGAHPGTPRTANKPAATPPNATPAPNQPPEQAPRQGSAATDFNPVRELLTGYRGSGKAIAVGVASIFCAVGLSAVSGWLIVKASYMPPVLHLLVAIVMVRALGIGRAALRYLEQLAIHDAVLSYAAVLREKIWNAMVAQPNQWGIISRSPVVLRYLLAEVDELRDLLARVVFPPVQALLVWGLGAWVLYLMQPSFGLGTLAVLAVTLLLIIPLMRRLEGRHLALALEHRLQVNERVLGILRTRGALRANRSLDGELAALARSERENLRRASSHALGEGVAVALLSLLVMALALLTVAQSQVSTELTAVAALLVLALSEPGTAALGALQQARALSELRARLAHRGMNEQSAGAGDAAGASSHRVHGFELRDLSLGYDSGQPLFTGLQARIEPGQWTALTGPSGSGKSTMLTALLGALEPLAGEIRTLDEHGRGHRLHRGDLTAVAWCPQEAHLFDSTLQRNLTLGVAGQLPDPARLVQVLQQVGLGSWYAQQPLGLETRIGSSGHSLSGGQRCKLAVARALLADKQVILLDEPTAHLGHREGRELLQELHRALAGRTVLLITHDADLAATCQNQIRLQPRPLLLAS